MSTPENAPTRDQVGLPASPVAPHPSSADSVPVHPPSVYRALRRLMYAALTALVAGITVGLGVWIKQDLVSTPAPASPPLCPTNPSAYFAWEAFITVWLFPYYVGFFWLPIYSLYFIDESGIEVLFIPIVSVLLGTTIMLLTSSGVAYPFSMDLDEVYRPASSIADCPLITAWVLVLAHLLHLYLR